METSNTGQSDAAAKPKCPLCGSGDTLFETKIGIDLIVQSYWKEQRELVKHDLKGTPWIEVYRCRRCSLVFFDPELPGSPEFYAGFQSFDWYYLEDKAEYEMAIKWMPPGARVLEVGCGVGWFGKKLTSAQYTGLEYSHTAAEKARASGLDVRTESIEGHAQACPAAYQVVCSFQVLEHVSGPGAFIASCIECIEPGGLLIFAVPSEDSYLKFVQNGFLNLPPHHLTHWPDKTLEAIAGIFPVSLVAIEHEVVADCHLQAYVSTMISRRLNAILGRPKTVIDHSITAKLLNKFASVTGGWMSKMFDDAVFLPRGHTVLATYRKDGALDRE
jgi:2-polyprenyl-3-methyl-5-hydroxy-6-metoxy-1,4-benzoquinol methylase